jgi:hypothetical protein
MRTDSMGNQAYAVEGGGSSQSIPRRLVIENGLTCDAASFMWLFHGNPEESGGCELVTLCFIPLAVPTCLLAALRALHWLGACLLFPTSLLRVNGDDNGIECVTYVHTRP